MMLETHLLTLGFYWHTTLLPIQLSPPSGLSSDLIRDTQSYRQV